MKSNQLKNPTGLHQLYERFAQRLERRYIFCLQASQRSQAKLRRIERYCEQHGFIFSRSTINMIRTSLSTMMTSAFDNAIEQNSSAVVQQEKTIDIHLQLTHVNALPSRTERGIFLVIELGNDSEDVRYSLVSLLGKQIPSYDILHSRGYDLPESIRRSRDMILLDRLAIGLKDFLNEVSERREISGAACIDFRYRSPGSFLDRFNSVYSFIFQSNRTNWIMQKFSLGMSVSSVLIYSNAISSSRCNTPSNRRWEVHTLRSLPAFRTALLHWSR